MRFYGLREACKGVCVCVCAFVHLCVCVCVCMHVNGSLYVCVSLTTYMRVSGCVDRAVVFGGGGGKEGRI